MQMLLGFRILRHGLQIQIALDQRPRQRRRVPLVGAGHLDRHQGLGVQIDRVFGLVRQVGPPVLHLGDAGLRVVRMLPVLVGAFARPLLVEPSQILARRRLDPFGLGQALQVLAVALPGVPPHHVAQGGVGLQGRGVHRQGLALEQPFLGQHAQHPVEHLLVDLLRQALADARQARVIRRGLAQGVAQKPPQGERVGDPPGDAPLRAQALEVADQEHAEIDPRRDARPAQRLRVIRCAPGFHKPVKPMGRQQLIQLRVKRTPRRLRQRVGRHPHLLLLTLGSSTHRHRSGSLLYVASA